MTTADNVAMLKEKEKTEPIARFLGINLVELTEGYSRVNMKMRSEYINFNGMVFGGIIMALADQAFAYATNSKLTPNLAIQFNINLISAVAAEDELTAECHVVKSGRRVSVSEMTVINQNDRLVARATGTTLFNG
jgi:acyl-CoA thioesterase